MNMGSESGVPVRWVFAEKLSITYEQRDGPTTYMFRSEKLDECLELIIGI